MNLISKQYTKEKTSFELFVFSILFLLTVVAWIAVEIHHIEKNKKFSVEYQTGMNIEIKKLPSLEILEKLKIKKWVITFYTKKKVFLLGWLILLFLLWP